MQGLSQCWRAARRRWHQHRALLISCKQPNLNTLSSTQPLNSYHTTGPGAVAGTQPGGAVIYSAGAAAGRNLRCAAGRERRRLLGGGSQSGGAGLDAGSGCGSLRPLGDAALGGRSWQEQCSGRGTVLLAGVPAAPPMNAFPRWSGLATICSLAVAAMQLGHASNTCRSLPVRCCPEDVCNPTFVRHSDR